MGDELSWDGDKFSSWHPSPIMPAPSSKGTAVQGPPSWPPSPVMPAASTAQGLAPSWPPPVMPATLSMEVDDERLPAIGKKQSNHFLGTHFLRVKEVG